MSVDALAAAIRKAVHIYLCGNGGSAANAEHIATDLIALGIAATALTSSPIVTMIGNDFGYDRVFSYQIETLCTPLDLLIVLSGSGNSPNIIQALKAADEVGMASFGILGNNGGSAAELCDGVILTRPGMQESEEDQIVIGHKVRAILCAS